MGAEQRNIDFSIRLMEQMTGMGANLTSSMNNVAKTIGNTFRGAMNVFSEKSVTYAIDNDELRANIVKALEKQGIEFMSHELNHRHVISVRAEDEHKFLRVYHREHDLHGVISKHRLVEQSNTIHHYTNLTRNEAQLFAEKARESGIDVSVENPSRGRYNIAFGQEHSSDMAKIAVSVAYDLAGKSGEILQKQMDYQNAVGIAAAKSLTNPSAEDTYVVDRNGVIAYSNASIVTMEFGEKQVTVNKKENAREINAYVAAYMHRPVVLNDKEWAKYVSLTPKERSRYLDDLEKERGIAPPELTGKEKELMAQKEDARQAAEKYLSRHSPDSGIIQVATEVKDQAKSLLSTKYQGIYGPELIDLQSEDNTLFDDAKANLIHFEIKEDILDPEFLDRQHDRFDHERDDHEKMEKEEDINIEYDNEVSFGNEDLDEEDFDLANDINGNTIDDYLDFDMPWDE